MDISQDALPAYSDRIAQDFHLIPSFRLDFAAQTDT